MKEQRYCLKKELFTFQDNRYWLSCSIMSSMTKTDSGTGHTALRTGLSKPEGEEKGKMCKHMLSINNVKISEEERWFTNRVNVEMVTIEKRHL